MTEQLPVVAVSYFQATANYFWRWAEEQQVVEWQHGPTICYREELQAVLGALVATDQGLPPLGSVLLLLAGCTGWPEAAALHLWRLRRGYGEFLEDALSRWLEEAIEFLAQVAALPLELRTGPPKQHLFREVFDASGLGYIEPDQAPAILAEWTSGRVDSHLQTVGAATQWSQFASQLRPLATAARRFSAAGSLELLLRTGLSRVPAPLPEPPAVPAPLSDDLLNQLAQDTRTAGLARLAQHLVAALHIPLHTQGAGEQPLGGVADVTNRGSFDRLLLSELAHDEWSLLARLVNSEALYLRREEPPPPQARARTILLDTTLRLWGTPRVAALAAALAWAYQARQARVPVVVTAYALGGQTVTLLDLASLAGVVQALSTLDPALHCGAALQALGRSQAAAENTDQLLITEAQAAQQPAFSQQLAAAQPAVRFLLTVDRDGTLTLFEYVNGHRTRLSATQHDLDHLLAAAPTRRPPRPRLPATRTDTPAYLRCVPAPLCFPTTGMRVSSKNTFYHPALGVLGITETQRVLYWPSRDTGARELLAAVEPGIYHFGTDQRSHIYLLVSGPGLLRAYRFDAAAETVASLDASAELSQTSQELFIAFQDYYFYVQRAGRALVIDCQQWQVISAQGVGFPATPTVYRPDFGYVKRHINNGYSVLQRLSHLRVNAAGELLLNGYALRLASEQASTLKLLSTTATDLARPAHAIATHADVLGEPLLVRRFAWPNGSEALLDGRGLLHLRSADVALPELTLLLVLGQPTAAWAANGTVCGPAYFTGHDPSQRLPAAAFYQQYIQRFTAPLT
jgi:hypothetical protein